MKNLPRIEGKKVVLRPLGGADAEVMFRIFQSPDLTRLTGSQIEHSLEDVRNWYAGLAHKDDRVDFGITLAESGQLIGEAVLNEIDVQNRSANFRILLDTEYAGRGFGTEASYLTIQHGFEQVGLNRIDLGVYEFNPRAIRVYEKIGFVREGVRREALWWDGKPYDEIIMGLLERDFRPMPGDTSAAES